MAVTANYSFPLIAESQNNKYLTHNDAINDIDTTLFGLVGGVALLATNNAWTKAQYVVPVTLTDASSIATNLALSNNFIVTLGGNRTLANPTNIHAGQAGQIVVKQDGTGSRTLAFGSDWKFAGGTAPTMTTTANAIDVLSYYVVDSTHILVSTGLNFS